MADFRTSDVRRWHVHVIRRGDPWPLILLPAPTERGGGKLIRPDKIIAVYDPDNVCPLSVYAVGRRVVKHQPLTMGSQNINVPFNPVIPPDWVRDLLAQAERPPWVKAEAGPERTVLHDRHAVSD